MAQVDVYNALTPINLKQKYRMQHQDVLFNGFLRKLIYSLINLRYYVHYVFKATLYLYFEIHSF